MKMFGIGGLTWDVFKDLLKEQFYPIGYEEKRWQNWLFYKQENQGVQDYTTNFRRKALSLGVALNHPETLRKYLAGLRDEIQKEVTLVPIATINAAYKRAVVFEDIRPKVHKEPNKQNTKTS